MGTVSRSNVSTVASKMVVSIFFNIFEVQKHYRRALYESRTLVTDPIDSRLYEDILTAAALDKDSSQQERFVST